MIPTSLPSRQPSLRKQTVFLTWGRWLHSPAGVLSLLAGCGALAMTAGPGVAAALRDRLPTGTLRPVVSRSLAPSAKTAPTPSAAPVVAAATTTNPSPTASPSAAPVATINLRCHVLHSGLAAGTRAEWTVEVTLDENATDGRGQIVLPAGTVAAGRVRLNHRGEPAEWPGVWTMHLPEGDGTTRDLELTAFYQANLGGIAVGANGSLSVQAINRVGNRREGPAALASQPADPAQPPVSILTGRSPLSALDGDDLPRR